MWPFEQRQRERGADPAVLSPTLSRIHQPVCFSDDRFPLLRKAPSGPAACLWVWAAVFVLLCFLSRCEELMASLNFRLHSQCTEVFFYLNRKYFLNLVSGVRWRNESLKCALCGIISETVITQTTLNKSLHTSTFGLIIFTKAVTVSLNLLKVIIFHYNQWL